MNKIALAATPLLAIFATSCEKEAPKPVAKPVVVERPAAPAPECTKDGVKYRLSFNDYAKTPILSYNAGSQYIDITPNGYKGGSLLDPRPAITDAKYGAWKDAYDAEQAFKAKPYADQVAELIKRFNKQCPGADTVTFKGYVLR